MPKEPFRTPFLKRLNETATSDDPDSLEFHRQKRRISDEHELPKTIKVSQLTFKVPGISSLPRKPLSTVKNSVVPTGVGQPTSQGTDNYYNVLWYTNYLHKPFSKL